MKNYQAWIIIALVAGIAGLLIYQQATAETTETTSAAPVATE